MGEGQTTKVENGSNELREYYSDRGKKNPDIQQEPYLNGPKPQSRILPSHPRLGRAFDKPPRDKGLGESEGEGGDQVDIQGQQMAFDDVGSSGLHSL